MCDFKDLAELNTFLATRSYVEGYNPSQADVQVFSKISGDLSKFPHVARYAAHIGSFSVAARAQFPGKSGAAPAKAAAKPAAEEEEEEDVLDFDALDDEEDDAETAAILAKKKAEAEAAKKTKKPAAAARSSVILDVKPEGSETDMDALEANVRAITMDGLQWAGKELVPVAFGVKKLRIIAVVVDDLVSVDDLQTKIEDLEDVQSTDIHAFNKV